MKLYNFIFKSSLINSNFKCFQNVKNITRYDYNRRNAVYRLMSTETNPKLPNSRGTKLSSRAPMTWKGFLGTSIFGAGLIGFVLYLRKEKEAAIETEKKRMLGKAKIGGSFDLIDHNGVPKTSDDFKGQWCLIYFGFTHCPDICPDELEKMGAVVDAVDKNDAVGNIQPLFITVDPHRDSAELVKQYCQEFHPKLLGLTGSVEKVGEACRAYRVYFSAGPRDDDDDYIVDHTVIIYLVNPEGEFVDYYGQNKTAEEISSSVTINMGFHSPKR